MSAASDALDGLADELPELCQSHDLPGIAIGLLDAGDTHVLSHGVTSLDNQVSVTDDTVFQIGSNTKLYTATLAMILVDRGRLSLDDRVVDHLPDFRIGDGKASSAITVRHLLTHMGGMDGDYPGPEPHEFSDEMLARYVTSMADLDMLHQPGTAFSYCNSGFVLLGRLVEVASGMPYHRALAELLTEPLHATHTRVLPQEIVPFRAAIGHLPSLETGRSVVAPAYLTAPACTPAGSTPVATVADVLRFVELHLAGGVTPDGTRLFSAETAALMRQRQTSVPPLGHTTAWGLGWMLGESADGQNWIGHTGGTLGQISFVEVLPDRGTALIILTNAVGGGALGLALVRRLLHEVAGAQLPEPPSLPDRPAHLDLTRYVGRYERRGSSARVSAASGGIEVAVHEDPPHPDYPIPDRTLTFVPVDEQTFIGEGGSTLRFLQPDADGRPAYLFNSRLLPRRA